MPFSQKCRGFLSYYPQVLNGNNTQVTGNRKRAKIFAPHFNPRWSLLQNWELFYEVLLQNNSNETGVLYRACCVLVTHPHICQPFLQLLLNKLTQPCLEEHLIPSICSILQEQPNCVGASWKPLFARSPTRAFLFDLSALVHFSKELTLTNFIWFVRNFCQHVELSANYKECLKLVAYNAHRPDCQERMQIIDKEMLTLFTREYNVYYQLAFVKGLFALPYLPLALTLLQAIPVNVITDSLLALTLAHILTHHWAAISAYDAREIEDEQIGVGWSGVVKKIGEVAQHNPALLGSVSGILKGIEQCYQYYL